MHRICWRTAAETVHRLMSCCSLALWVRMATHRLITRPPVNSIVWIWAAYYVLRNPCNDGCMPYTFTAMWNKHSPAYAVGEKLKSWIPLTQESETKKDRFAFIYFRLPSPSALALTTLWFHAFPAASEGGRTVMSTHFQPCEICDHSAVMHDHWPRLPSLNHLKTTPGWRAVAASTHIRPLVYNTDTRLPLWERERCLVTFTFYLLTLPLAGIASHAFTLENT